MTQHSTPAAPIGRGLALTLGASAAVAVLTALPLAAPPTDPSSTIGWWDDAGTAHATVALVRVIALAAAAYVAVLGAVITLSALARLPRLAHAAARGLPAGLQRSLAGATIAASTLAPSFAAATDDTEPLSAPIVLFDIGSAEAAPPAPTAAIEVTPTVVVPAAEVAGPEFEEATEPADRWTVQRGDHLWSIAEDTLIELGGDDGSPSNRQIARYWQRLIDDNRGVIGPDLDVIHPGTTLVLPGI
jgi:hypothetical protein